MCKRILSTRSRMSSAVRTTGSVKAEYNGKKHHAQNYNYRDAQDNCSSCIG